LDKVLLIASDDKVVVGRPHVKGAKVLAEAVGEVRDDKVIVFHFKPKVRIRPKGASAIPKLHENAWEEAQDGVGAVAHKKVQPRGQPDSQPKHGQIQQPEESGNTLVVKGHVCQ
jgi:hypothetical protein